MKTTMKDLSSIRSNKHPPRSTSFNSSKHKQNQIQTYNIHNRVFHKQNLTDRKFDHFAFCADFQMSDEIKPTTTTRRRVKKRIVEETTPTPTTVDVTVKNSNKIDDEEALSDDEHEVELETKSAADDDEIVVERQVERPATTAPPPSSTTSTKSKKKSKSSPSVATLPNGELVFDAATPAGIDSANEPSASPVSQLDHNGDDGETKPLLRRMLDVCLDNKCYIVTIFVLIVIALLLGFLAFDLPNIHLYSPQGDYTNSFRLRVRVESTSPLAVNVTSLINDPAKPLDVSFRFINVTTTSTSLPPLSSLSSSTMTTMLATTQQPMNISSSTVVVADNNNATASLVALPLTMMYDIVIRIVSKKNVTTSDVALLYNNFTSFNSANNRSGIVVRLSAPIAISKSDFKAPTVVFRSYAAWLTLFIIVGILALLLKEDTLSPDAVLMLALTILTLAQVITVKESLAGFANEGIATIGALYMVALAIGNSGALDAVSRYLLRSPSSITWALVRLMLPCAFLSAFINNTPIVAMMIPVVLEWSSTVGVAPSKLLIPLSYAALLGGVVTLIGTSTNLVVKALIVAKDPTFEMPLFEMALVGAPTCVMGLVYMIFIGHRILPSRESVDQKFRKDPRAYTAHIVVRPKSPLAGRTIADAGLRQLKGLFIYEVDRPTTGETFAAPSSEFKLQSEDVLAVAGDVTQVDALFKVDGLQMHTEGDVNKVQRKRGDNHRLVEVVVARGCDMIGRTPREFRFRSVFNAAIVAIHRHGEQIATRIGDVRLHAGDTLLLVTDSDFAAIHRGARQFALISEVGRANVRARSEPWKIAVVCVLSTAMIVLSSIDSLGQSLFVLAVTASYVFWLLGIITLTDARNSVTISVMVMVAAAIGLSSAMDNSGLANRIGASLVSLFGASELGLMFGVYVGTTILNAFVSNSAAVSLIFPIGYEIARTSQANGGVITQRMMAYLIMMAGSADFSTPIGYQTNLMVYSVGGYRFFDYAKVGLPLQIVVMISSVIICYYGYRY